MSYLLDTNVVSELVRPAPQPEVVAWAAAQPALALYLSVLTLGELEKGIARLSAGARRTQLARWAAVEIPRQFLGRVLAADAAVAIAWGGLAAAGQGAGRPLPVVDGLLVATARVHGLTLVTRNVGDCAGHGVPVLDPWTGVTHAP